MMKALAIALAGGLALIGGVAQAQMRTLDVPATAGWKHAQTGLILMPRLGGQIRQRIQNLGTAEIDLAASYAEETSRTYTTIYLFHPGFDSVPVWFDRIRVAAVSNRGAGVPDGAEVPSAFAVHPGGVADSPRIAFTLHDGTNKSTAAAVMPVEDWLVVVRISSNALDSAALDERLNAVLRDIGWPAAKRPAIAAVPVEACASQLKLKRARLLKPNMMQALLGSTVALSEAKKAEKPDSEPPKPVVYCRDSVEPNGQWALYRADGARSSYVLALGGAGRAIEVRPSIAGLLGGGGGEPSYSFVLDELDRKLIFPDVDRLPPPAQALAIIASVSPVSSLSGNGANHNITLDAGLAPRK